MKHLLSGTALAAALVIAAPVWAQTPMTPSSRAPAATAPTAASEAPMATTAHHKRMRMHHHATARHGKTARGASPSDNMANQLNAQELGRVGGSSPPGMAQPNPTQGGDYLSAPGTLGGGYGQPAPTQGIPGGNQPAASSHPPYGR